MNRIRIPYCSKCKTNYHVGDLKGPKIPVLLDCGHDICRNCLRFNFRKFKQVICDVCQTVIKSELDDQLCNDIPIHYYLVGKVLCLSNTKQQQIYHDMINLKMTNLPSKTLKEIKNTCSICDKYACYFCNQCDKVHCENCNEMVHKEDKLMSRHIVETLSNTHSAFKFEKPKCDTHIKLHIDFICVTCELKMCSICAIEDHQQHDVHYLENYNKNTIHYINDYLRKGENLLGKLKHYKNEYSVKMQKHQSDYLRQKNTDFDKCRQTVTKLMSSLVGFIQFKEQSLMNTLDRAELAVVTSLNNIVNQLDGFVNDLNDKLNTTNVLIKSNQLSSEMMTDTIAGIKRMLDTTYYVGKKNKIKPSVVINNSISQFVSDCIVSNIDDSDTYILQQSSILPPDYTLSTEIEVSSVQDTALPKSPSTLSFSSSSTTSSNFSNILTKVSKRPLFDYSFIKELTINRVDPVIITHVNSPSDFYFQLYDNNSIILMINNELSRFVETDSSDVELIEKGNVMYAVQNSLNQWQRGIVVHAFEEDGESFYTVYCIDYGYTETLTGNRIKRVSDSVVLIPPLAYNCALYELKPCTTTGWSNDAYKLFTELILTKTGTFFVYPMKTDTTRIEVDVVWKEHIYPLSIRDTMFYLGYGNGLSGHYINNAIHEKILSTIVMPEPYKLEEGVEYVVLLTHFNSPYEFYLRIEDDSTDLQGIMLLLDKIYKPTENNMNKSYLLYTPQIGLPVAARYSIDGSWYRAKIIGLPELRMVTVFYVDYGNSETLQWDQLRVLDKQLIKTPPLAIKSKLADVNPAVEGIECANWSTQACSTFINLLNTNIKENLTAIMHHDPVDSNGYKVVLFNNVSRRNICVNSKLISLGHATTLDPGKCLFQKPNMRGLPLTQSTTEMNSRNLQVEKKSNDTLAFISQRSVINNEHMWDQTNKKNVPGVQMSVIKVVSPDDIILKSLDHNSAQLTKRINKVYMDKKTQNTKKCDWKTNDLCAVFLKKYGNWYRGKIINIDAVKKTASVYLYDINETLAKICINKLYELKQTFINEKCGIIHCRMEKLIPLGNSDKKWSKFSCDRLIEKLAKYPHVYFAKKDKKDGVDLGEIWVRDIEIPHPLEQLKENWLNMNTFMIEQGFAISDKQDKKVSNFKSKLNQEDEHNPFTQSELDVSNTFDMFEHTRSINCNWLPPDPLTKSQFNAIPTNVDMECQVYLLNIDECSETSQQLNYISHELNCLFANSKPEPINYKWTKGQMVIVKFHLDNMWYRGTILKIENDRYFVQFLDYGNIENCSHDDLRSTLYMTDIPQLCIKGYFDTISPFGENGAWPISTLDFVHALVVDKPCTVTVDLTKYANNTYPIKHMKNELQSNIGQYLVSSNYAYFNYVNISQLNFSEHTKSSKMNDFKDIVDEENEQNNSVHSIISSYTLEVDNDNFVEESDDDNFVKESDDDNFVKESDDDNFVEESDDNNFVEEIDDEYQKNSDKVQVPSASCAEENIVKTESVDDSAVEYHKDIEIEESCFNKEEQKLDYTKFCLKSNEVFEGSLCYVVGPTRVTLMVQKIDGYDLRHNKDKMQAEMNEKCDGLLELDEIVPGTAVVVLYNVFWRRGTIMDDGKSVFLVDLGISTKLNKRNLRLCPAEFLKLPMLSIDCQLINVMPNENINADEIVEKMWKLLRNIKLKIVGAANLAEFNIKKHIVDVELYNDKDEIAYQSLIDSQLLVPVK